MPQWKLREIMEHQKLTDQALTAQVQMHEFQINQLKSIYSISSLDEKLLKSLCAAVNCTVFELLGYHQEMF